MRPIRRALLPEPGPGYLDCLEFKGFGCPPPAAAPSSLDPGPGPAPSPGPRSWIPLCPPIGFLGPSPSPSPSHGASGGRHDQGGARGYGPPPPGDDAHRRGYVMYVLVAAAVIAFVSVILLGVSVAVRRRQVRRRQQALLAATAPGGAGNGPEAGGGGNGDPEGGGGGGGVVHHIWYIRTVGLDEAAIDSIAATRYRAGAGLLGAADCSVCLGEFQDGELVRLLPKCGHAFHVPCIDTWLRAHVNCPLCRSDVLDPAVTAASGDGAGAVGGEPSAGPPADPDANADAAAEQAAAASDAAPDHEEGESESDHHQEEAVILPVEEEDQDERSSPPEPPPPQLPAPLPRNVRRAASMDAAAVSTAADVAALERLPQPGEAPEEEQPISDRRKRGTGGPSYVPVKESGSGHRSSLAPDRPGGVPRSFFSRHCRARSSVLPLVSDGAEISDLNFARW